MYASEIATRSVGSRASLSPMAAHDRLYHERFGCFGSDEFWDGVANDPPPGPNSLVLVLIRPSVTSLSRSGVLEMFLGNDKIIFRTSRDLEMHHLVFSFNWHCLMYSAPVVDGERIYKSSARTSTPRVCVLSTGGYNYSTAAVKLDGGHSL